MAPPAPIVRVLALSCLLQLASSASLAGFVSIDCGGQAVAPYTDANGIEWTPDELYMPGVLGKSASLQPDTSVAPLDLNSTVRTLRYFPASLPQSKFCYSLGPVVIGNPYLLRTVVAYGNYDLLNQDSVTFSLLVNADVWSSVQLSKSTTHNVFELYAPALTTEFSVCVARNGTDDPFINSLELRPLAVNMRWSVTLKELGSSNYAASTIIRDNLGAKSTRLIRFPDDQYDRFWYPNSNTPSFFTNNDILTTFVDAPPSSVLQTAYGDGNLTHISLTYSSVGFGKFFLGLHFAEIGGATLGQRVFDVFSNGDRIPSVDIYALTGNQFQAYMIYDTLPLTYENFLNVTLAKTDTATLGPMVGAAELLAIWPDPLINTTNTADAAALENVKKSLHNLSDWTGDACLPTNNGYAWVICSSAVAPRITGLLLSSQNLSGSLAPDIGVLTALETIRLDNNKIEGNIPDLRHLQQLQKLDLQNNSLQGPIPDFLAALPKLSELFLQGNNLSGPIPQGLLEKMRNATLNFSYDRNAYLCVTPNATCKELTAPSPTSPTRKLQTYVTVLIIIGALLALGIAAMCCLCSKTKTRICWLPKKDAGKTQHDVGINPQPPNLPKDVEAVDIAAGINPQPPNLPKDVEAVDIAAHTYSFTLQDVRAMTNDFSDKIGRGGFGEVFRGKFAGGEYVAVKTLSKGSSQGVREFLSEVSILSRVHHKNLVSLVGYCNEPPERILIYEYISNGTLGEHLYGPNASQINWRTRVMIAIDAAQGLEYLHFACHPTIIHRDVKSSNILLNDKMEAKVADFGLSKPKLDNNASHITATSVMGTHGYIDPEYYATSLLTDKSDVYSFGVILFQLVCGCPAIDATREKPNLTDWARSFLLRGDLESIVDPVLGTKYSKESMWKVAELGLKSTERVRSNRPDMNKVVAELKESLRIELSQHYREAATGSGHHDSSRDFSEDLHHNSSSSTSFKDPDTFVRPR